MIDMRTSLYFLGFASLVFALLLSLTAKKNESRGIISVLVWAKLLQGIAFFLLAGRGEIPDVLSKNGGNSFLFAGFALDGIAAWIFAGRTQWRRIVLPVLLSAILIMNVFILAGASDAALVTAASFIVAILMIICSSAFLFCKRDRSPLMLTIGIIDTAVAIVNIVRGIIAILASPGFSLLSHGLV